MPTPPIDLDLMPLLNRPGTPWLDVVMETASHRGFLFALAVAAGLFIWLKTPKGGLPALVFAAAIGVADLVSVRIVKPQVARERPCRQDPQHVPHPLGCGAGQSFPSAHATDTAAAAAVFAWAAPRWSALGIAVALLVGVSRVYVGAHWPTDVLAGWALGAGVGTLLVLLVRLRLWVRT